MLSKYRLAFHDCVGGCDGCVNVNDQYNSGKIYKIFMKFFTISDNILLAGPGLSSVVKDLEVVYQKNNFQKLLSR
jgi:hypothetical protein